MIRALVLGSTAALRTPVVVARRGLPPLLRPAEGDPSPSVAWAESDRAVGIAFAALRWLSRIPMSPWRNSCLYRAVSECLVLRAAGAAATLRLGVGRDDSAAITAHAWVVAHGHTTRTERATSCEEFRTLEFGETTAG